jgi:acetate kinase
MRVLVINSGSSSLKFKLFSMQDQSVLCSGLIEEIGDDESTLTFSLKVHERHKTLHIKDHEEALSVLFDLLFDSGVIVTLDELGAVSHRVVHGGAFYTQATVIDEEVLSNLVSLVPLAPLHNPANIAGIRAVRAHAKELTQVAVFDTAFHHSMPAKAYRYALPGELYETDKIRRYGFHGTSHAYITKATARYLNKGVSELNIISLHLGNGASACAVKEGKSIDTSMGMTPLEGLVMGSRSGDIDPSIIVYLQQYKGYSIEKIDHLLNHESGLVGLCGENDMRTIIKKAKTDEDYRLALEVFVYRIQKYIGAYMAILGRVDAIVFTGGIGEHADEVREMVCHGLEGLGIVVDPDATGKVEIQSASSAVRICVIPTDEELEIAIQTKALLSVV